MTIDVIDLRDFYSQRLGIVARQLINRGIRARWPDAAGQRVLGLGYPTPYLGLFREDSERCIAFMPAAQGVLKWPTARPALATLVDAGVMGRSAVPAAGRQQLVPALGDSMGACWRCAVAAVRRRPYRGGDQAGLSRDPRGPRTHAVDSVAGTGAGALVDGDKG